MLWGDEADRTCLMKARLLACAQLDALYGSRGNTNRGDDPKSARVTETNLNAGDVVILGESDVARFEYHH